MKKLPLIFLIFLFLILGCNAATNVSTNSERIVQNEYPSLRIVTQYKGYIYRIGLVGYSFEDLRMETGEEKVFNLIQGIPGGNDNVNVTLSFRPNDQQIVTTSPASVKCNFVNGKTTTITLGADYTLKVSY